jgi:hypothetical protein
LSPTEGAGSILTGKDEPDLPGGVGLASTLLGFEDFAAREVKLPGAADTDELQFGYHMADPLNGYGAAVVSVVRRLASEAGGRSGGGEPEIRFHDSEAH